jgi:protein-disulfide isomerase
MSTSRPSGASRETKAQARDRLAAERAAAAAAQKRKERTLRVLLAGVVVLVVVAVGVAVVLSRRTTEVANASVPAGVTATKGYPTGTATKPVLDIYEDFQCPNCRDFEAANRSQIEALATDGKAQVVYHTLTFLDSSNTANGGIAKSSTRAANAAACAQDQGTFLAYHDQLFRNQSQKEGAGWTDDQLKAFGSAAGIPDQSRFEQCVSSGQFNGFLTQVTAEADQRQVTGTPSFFVDGVAVDITGATSWSDVGSKVLAAVAKASGS